METGLRPPWHTGQTADLHFNKQRYRKVFLLLLSDSMTITLRMGNLTIDFANPTTTLYIAQKKYFLYYIYASIISTFNLYTQHTYLMYIFILQPVILFIQFSSTEPLVSVL